MADAFTSEREHLREEEQKYMLQEEGEGAGDAVESGALYIFTADRRDALGHVIIEAKQAVVSP